MTKKQPRTSGESAILFVRIPAALHRDLNAEAVKRGVSLNRLVVALLERKKLISPRTMAKAAELAADEYDFVADDRNFDENRERNA